MMKFRNIVSPSQGQLTLVNLNITNKIIRLLLRAVDKF